jgi:ribonuclease III
VKDKKKALAELREKKLDALEATLGLRFANRDLLRLALTHSSLRDEFTQSNERLEFLGDSVLGLAVAQHLFATFPALHEGELTKLKSMTVSGAALTAIGKRLELVRFLDVGKGVRKGRGVPPSLIANAVEAIVGAVYLDAGFDAVRELVVSWLDAEVRRAAEKRSAINHKAALQQMTQRVFASVPSYAVIEELGPDHKKEFVIAVRIGVREFPQAKGKTKKIAEQRAARLALRELKRDARTDVRPSSSTGSP